MPEPMRRRRAREPSQTELASEMSLGEVLARPHRHMLCLRLYGPPSREGSPLRHETDIHTFGRHDEAGVEQPPTAPGATRIERGGAPSSNPP